MGNATAKIRLTESGLALFLKSLGYEGEMTLDFLLYLVDAGLIELDMSATEIAELIVDRS